MKKIAIIIPARLDAERLPNKPLKLINNKEMILHVYELAKNCDVSDVIVATPDQSIAEKVNKIGGRVALTKKEHQTGTDRIHEALLNELNGKADLIINLQGDMPNLKPEAVNKLITHMKEEKCDIATLASNIEVESDMRNKNVVKVETSEHIDEKKIKFSKAKDFFRIANNSNLDNVYHHIGIYAFTNKALLRYVRLDRTKLEIERKLEQLRALDNKMKIDVGYIGECPLSVDTEEDLKKIKKIMGENVKS